MGKNHSTPAMSLSAPKPRRSQNKITKNHDLRIHTDAGFFVIKNLNFSMTCGWLLSEAIRKYDGSLNLVALKTLNGLDIIDEWLLRFEKPLKPLREIHELEAIFCEELHDSESEDSLLIKKFKFIKTIGTGSHSNVILCRKVDTGILYAVKIVEKLEVQENSRLDQIITERTVLSQVSQSFIVKMHWALQSDSQFFFVFGFCPGGELRFHLKNIGRLTESQARFYFSEILIALDYFHKCNVTYNNIKAENIMLDLDGHIKLIDFKLASANFLDDSTTFTLGLSQFILTDEEDEDHSQDFHDLGMLLYELLTASKPRFPDLIFPKYLSENCRNLLSLLLLKKKDSKITSSILKNHPWTEGIDWVKISRKRVSPPFYPSFKNSNFSPTLSKIEIQIDYQSGDYIRGFDFMSPQVEKSYFNIREMVLDSNVTSERSSINADDPLNNLSPLRSLDTSYRVDMECSLMHRNTTTEERRDNFRSLSPVERTGKSFSLTKYLAEITSIKFFKEDTTESLNEIIYKNEKNMKDIIRKKIVNLK